MSFFMGKNLGPTYHDLFSIIQFAVNRHKMEQPAKSNEKSQFLNLCFPHFSIFFSEFLQKDAKSYVLAFKKMLNF